LKLDVDAAAFYGAFLAEHGAPKRVELASITEAPIGFE
jgi:hypothetical protein